jgi:alginate O-acetyltransferase complex protein AlgI
LGIFNLSIGLAKKLIIADQLATAVNPLFSNYAQLDFFAAWIAVLGYTYQLYFDFSGYTDIAIGIGYLLGFQLPQNFNAPYTARNITDFWQRWHITLSNWFRDYLFFPLSRALLKRNHSQNPDRVRTISHLTTMALIGLWHGANWTFVIWGVYHGIMLAIHSQTRAKHWRALSTWLSRALTFFCVVMGWVIFRSTSLDMAAHIYEALFGLRGFSADLQALSGDIGVRFLLVILSLIILTNLPRDTWALQPRQGWVYAAGMAALLVICLLALGAPTPFLYFQF